jgi:ectoine hydroxylase-related dioxygenase (phytanoyl-CoA dioxygenase family)
MIEPLWLDRPDAKSLVDNKPGGNAESRAVAKSMIETGFAVIPRAVDGVSCDQVVADFDRYVKSFGQRISEHTDKSGRLLRLVNFHLMSQAAARIGTDARIMEILDFLFGRTAGIYTSLYFEYGTQQPIHRDSPFFETFPRNYFFGVWVALEDIDPEAGPLMYVPGGHRFECDPHAIYREVVRAHPDVDRAEQVRLSLERYYGCVIETSSEVSAPVSLALKKGDVAIWHPQLPHGGSPAVNPMKTRRSMVFHCAPADLQVYQHDVFFMHPDDAPPPPPRYGFLQMNSRSVAAAGDTAFQH